MSFSDYVVVRIKSIKQKKKRIFAPNHTNVHQKMDFFPEYDCSDILFLYHNQKKGRLLISSMR